jgi:hypothetical protein
MLKVNNSSSGGRKPQITKISNGTDPAGKQKKLLRKDFKKSLRQPEKSSRYGTG